MIIFDYHYHLLSLIINHYHWLSENPKKYQLLTHLLTTWNQELLAHLKSAFAQIIKGENVILGDFLG